MNPGSADIDKNPLGESAAELYEDAPCGYISTLPDGTIINANRTFVQWCGYTRELLFAKRFQDLLPIAGKIYFDTHYQPLLLMQGYVREVALDLVCANGERLPVFLNAVLKKDAMGAPLVIRATLLDARGRRTYEKELLAAKRRAEEAETSLRRLNDDLEAQVARRTAERDRLWRTAQDILAVGLKGRHFLACNPAFTAVLGWTEDELKNMSYADLVPPEEFPQFERGMAALEDGNALRQILVRRRHKDGSYRWLSWNIVPEGELLYFVGRDVTEEKRQADFLRSAEEALRQAQKMEAIGQLTGGLAHDFNNLLAGIVGNLEMMRVKLAQGRTDELSRHIDAAESTAAKAKNLIRRMLAFARRQSLELEEIDLNQLVSSMSDLLNQTLGADVVIEFTLAPGLWPVHSDRNQLENALLNLAVNARDAMPGGGRLIISTANVEVGDGGEAAEVAAAEVAAAIPGVPPGKYVSISVKDTGVGMPHDVASRAFEPFFTTKPSSKGTGLGLSMIFGFIKQSGGHATIQSEPGRGTTVSLLLPKRR